MSVSILDIEKSNKYLAYSFLIHIGVLAIAFYAGKFHLADKKTFQMNMIESSVRVDVVAMPTLTPKELKTIDLSAPTESPAKGDHGNIDSSDSDTELIVKKKKTSFEEMMKKLSQKKLKVKPRQKEKERGRSDGRFDSQSEHSLNKLVLAGNKISQGQLLYGKSNKIERRKIEKYLLELPHHVKPHWKLPSFLQNQDLKCRIRIFIEQSGQLIRAEIFESSGNDEYDRRAMEAVKNSNPFPGLDKEIKTFGVKGEIALGFPL